VIVFDLEFEKAGAGVLHLEQRIKSACDQSVATLDLLAPKSDYKMDWADATIGVTDFAVPLTVKGRLFVDLYLCRLRPRLKSLAPLLPRSVRRMASTAAVVLTVGL
jgi:CelD/BcsL family acetyltransferase involved in cellulose biosynthesis